MKDKSIHFILGKSGYGKEYHESFIKEINGDKVYCLEYDKETLKDMVIEKQEEIKELKDIIKEVRELVIQMKEDSHPYYDECLVDNSIRDILEIINKVDKDE